MFRELHLSLTTFGRCFWIWTIAASLSGCSASTESASVKHDHGTGGQATGGSGGEAAGGSGGIHLDAAASDGPSMVSDEGCLVYLIGLDGAFYNFNPPTLEIKRLGYLNCPPLAFPQGGPPTPFSMAVDRKGIAWVLYNSGHLYNVDIKSLACTPTAYEKFQLGFFQFGMAFVSDTSGGEAESLYVSDFDGKGLAKIDTETLKLDFISSYIQLQGRPGELTGTGSARLFGFFHDDAQVPGHAPDLDTVAELEKTNAGLLSNFPQASVKIAGGWAFAFWGGDFYMFTAPNEVSSEINKFNLKTGVTTKVMPDVGSVIVGAGVSTCAPFEPPA